MWHDKFCLGTSRVSGGLQRDRKPPSRAAEAEVHLTAHSNRGLLPAGSKHQWSQRQVLPVAGAALSWSCFSHEQLHVLPGAAEIDDSLLS